jgi:hypothetical protein
LKKDVRAVAKNERKIIQSVDEFKSLNKMLSYDNRNYKIGHGEQQRLNQLSSKFPIFMGGKFKEMIMSIPG